MNRKKNRFISWNRLPLRSLTAFPGRTWSLIALTAILSFLLFGGSIFLKSLETGFSTLEDRLGADVIVVPEDAEDKLQKVVLEGVPNYFYMDKKVLDEVEKFPEVEKASAQYFLCSAKAGCCSMPVQIIGYDPDTDFSVTPWIRESTKKELGLFDIVVGANINADAGGQIKFYGNTCQVIAKLSATGSQLDNAVYATNDTILALTRSSVEKGINYLAQNSPEDEISAVQIQVSEGQDPESVAGKIVSAIKGTAAVQTSTMLSGLSDSLSGGRKTIHLILLMVWVLSAVILFIAETLLIRTRTAEFAYIRTIGASRRMLSGMILAEALLCGLAGSLIGCLTAAVILKSFKAAIEAAAGMPYLSPGLKYTVLAALLSAVITLLSGGAAAFLAAFHTSRADTGTLLRKEN